MLFRFVSSIQSFGGFYPPNPPLGTQAPSPNPSRISFSVGCLHAAVHTFVAV
ncbi:unknown protein [Microcystis aeruginosa NIES-843]|uniref:Uncharacterized protein n=1 Tax=Microcystis aeruginosa (strain NIES-843 / IAM M-2473) TaxID=449447 RepID=B0JUM3_MICAN|nr:unknown protein [Microcystis aeruginosa NIES-843]